MPRKSERHRGFGVLVGRIRKERKETQREFAATLHVSRSLLGRVETASALPSLMFIAALKNAAPDKADEIDALARQYRQSSPRPRRKAVDQAAQSDVMRMIAAGELSDAFNVLWHILHSQKSINNVGVWAAETLAQVYKMLGDQRKGEAAFDLAIELARLQPANHERAILAWDQYAHFCLDSNREKSRWIIDQALRLYPNAGLLWYRKAVTDLEACRMNDAQAAINASLALKGPRLDSLCIRAQIFLDANDPISAAPDIDEILTTSQVSVPQIAWAHGAQSYALYLAHLPRPLPDDRLPRRQPEFTGSALEALTKLEAEYPASPWPPYFLALCYWENYSFYVRDGSLRQMPAFACITDAVDLWAKLRDVIRGYIERSHSNPDKYLEYYRQNSTTYMLSRIDKDHRSSLS